MKSAQKRHILEEHYLDFYSRAVNILNNEDEARDAVQEAVVKTLVRVGLRDMVAYCYRTTENECINIIRHKRRMMPLDEEPTNADYEDYRLQRELKESKELLLPMERRILELRYNHGYNIEETAAKVGISSATTKRLLASAEEKVKYNMTHDI